MLMIDCYYALTSKTFNMFKAIKFKVQKFKVQSAPAQ